MLPKVVIAGYADFSAKTALVEEGLTAVGEASPSGQACQRLYLTNHNIVDTREICSVHRPQRAQGSVVCRAKLVRPSLP